MNSQCHQSIRKRLIIYTVNGERFSGPWKNEDENLKKDDQPKFESKLKKVDKTQPIADTQAPFIALPLQSEEEVKIFSMYGEGCAIFTSKRRLLVAHDLSEAKPFQEYIFPKSTIHKDAELSHAVMTVVPNYDMSVRKKRAGIDHDIKKTQDSTTDILSDEEDDDDDESEKKQDKKSISSGLNQSGGSGLLQFRSRNKKTIMGSNTLDTTKVAKAGKGPLVLFGTPDRMSIIACYSHLYKDMKLDERLRGQVNDRENSGFTKIAISPDLKTVSAFHQASGYLFVFDLALTSNYLKFNTGISDFDHKLDALVYCGGESMMLYWSPENIGGGDQSLVLLVNCFGHYESFAFEGPITISQEIDCCRYITSSSVEMIERIPESTVEVFRIGSLAPAALLYDAYSDYVNERATCLKTIREIKNKELGDQSIDALSDAVNKCIDASCREFDSKIQEQLLNAAIYGRNFMKTSIDEAKTFQLKCKYIRIMNELRTRADIPITFEQIIALSPQVLVQRLSEMRQYLLAYKICDYMELSKAKVLEHWAKTKIRSQIEDRDDGSQMKLKESIIENLGKFSTSVSFSNIAMEAYKVRKPKLAKALLEVDSNPNSQIKLYLSMHETLSALDKAQISNDTDLLYVVILYLLKFFDPYYMFEMIYDKPMARKLFVSYCTQLGKYKKLENFYKYLKMEQNEDVASRENGFVQIRHAYKDYNSVDSDAEKRFAYYIEKAEAYFSERSADKLETVYAVKERELYGLQMKLEDETGEDFVGAPVQDTLYRIMISPTLKEKKGERKKLVNVMRKNFDVSKKRYYYSKIKALVYLNEWKKLEAFATRKTSPIGYVPFVEACLSVEKPEEALKYIPMVEPIETKIDYWISLLKFKEAIEAAFNAKDVDLLEYIRRKTKNTKTKDTIDQCIQQLSK